MQLTATGGPNDDTTGSCGGKNSDVGGIGLVHGAGLVGHLFFLLLEPDFGLQ